MAFKGHTFDARFYGWIDVLESLYGSWVRKDKAVLGVLVNFRLTRERLLKDPTISFGEIEIASNFQDVKDRVEQRLEELASLERSKSA